MHYFSLIDAFRIEVALYMETGCFRAVINCFHRPIWSPKPFTARKTSTLSNNKIEKVARTALFLYNNEIDLNERGEVDV